MKPLLVYPVSEISFDLWLSFTTKRSNMTTYIQAQFNKVRDLASAESETIQFTLQIAQLNAIQKILEPVVTETKLTPLRPMTKKRADFFGQRIQQKISDVLVR